MTHIVIVLKFKFQAKLYHALDRCRWSSCHNSDQFNVYTKNEFVVWKIDRDSALKPFYFFHHDFMVMNHNEIIYFEMWHFARLPNFWAFKWFCWRVVPRFIKLLYAAWSIEWGTARRLMLWPVAKIIASLLTEVASILI